MKAQGDGIAALFLTQSVYRRFQIILLLPFFLLLIAAHQVEQADLLRFFLCGDQFCHAHREGADGRVLSDAPVAFDQVHGDLLNLVL